MKVMIKAMLLPVMFLGKVLESKKKKTQEKPSSFLVIF
jgi:hypothetical protein